MLRNPAAEAKQKRPANRYILMAQGLPVIVDDPAKIEEYDGG